MKQIFTLLAAVLITATTYAQVGIGTNINPPHTSAALDITSTTAGFLPPRMTAVQRAAIPSPALGLMVFCTNCASGEGEIQVYYASGWKNIVGGDITDPPPVIGDYRDGGIVFYVADVATDLDGDGDLDTGLVCAIQDQSSGIRWYNGSYVTTGATATAVGTGAANTTTIVTAQGTTETSYAAGLAKAYAAGGYTDWFLPSKDELNKMYLKKEILEAVSGFTAFSDVYWSSTENGNYSAWEQNFDNGNQRNYNKTHTLTVRAVRAF